MGQHLLVAEDVVTETIYLGATRSRIFASQWRLCRDGWPLDGVEPEGEPIGDTVQTATDECTCGYEYWMTGNSAKSRGAHMASV